MKYEKKTNDIKKTLLLRVIGEIIRERRAQTGKGILLLSYEYDLSSSSLANLEKGTRDVQITTLWKIANALGLPFGEFVSMIESRLPVDFKLTEE